VYFDPPRCAATGDPAAPELQKKSFAYCESAWRSLAASGAAPPEEVGGTLQLGLQDPPGTLNSIAARTGTDQNLCRQYLYPPLTDFDPETLEIVPELAAARPAISADQRTYRWTLRPGVLWHRGRPTGEPVEVSTRDIEFSWRMIREPAVDANHVAAALGEIKELRVLDERTFEVELNVPYYRAELEFGMNFRVMPEHLCTHDPVQFRNDPLGRSPVGYGPYAFEEWVDGSHLTLRRFPTYWDRTRRPFRIERVRFVFHTDQDKAIAMFRRGELDIVAVQDPEQFDAARRDREFQRIATFHEYFLPRFNYIVWNNEHWAFRDPRVRRAMTLLYPRQVVVDKFYRGYAALTSGPWAVAAPEYDRSVVPEPFDPARAAALLKEAGFADADGDGLLERGGRRFEFVLQRPTTRVPAIESGNELFRQELRKAGIAMSIHPLDYTSKFLPNVRGHQFEAAQLGWAPEARDDDLYGLFHSSQADVNNYGLYRSAACDRLLEAYQREFDPAARIELAHQIHRQIDRDHPWTFMPAPKSIVLVSTRLCNVRIRTLGARFHDWWFAAP